MISDLDSSVNVQESKNEAGNLHGIAWHRHEVALIGCRPGGVGQDSMHHALAELPALL